MTWLNDAIVVTAEDKAEKAKDAKRVRLKAEKQQSIAGLTYQPLTNLSAIQVRPQDWANIEAQLSIGSGTEWIMANNTVEFVEHTDLAAALAFGKEEYQRITQDYIEGLKALYDIQ